MIEYVYYFLTCRKCIIEGGEVHFSKSLSEEIYDAVQTIRAYGLAIETLERTKQRLRKLLVWKSIWFYGRKIFDGS